ncbi:MAG: hypothetical protein R3B97_03235 [Dehalococcoidia bacterium]|nr:hypothetical protein [Dehalococcoidia bacterium]MCB9485046.1 hypothetical protein [Thermoflexaceae bacterium]
MLTRIEVRNLDPELIASYLVDELAGHRSGRVVDGPGWAVHLVRGEQAGVGKFRVPVLYLDVTGSRQLEVAAFLRRKTMRGGG